MNEAEITQYILDTFEGVHAVDAWGDTFFFYNPHRILPDEIYFATLKNKDDSYDQFSHLDRPEVFRLNIGVGRSAYRRLFGAPKAGGETTEAAYDFTALDQMMPHPVYAKQHWVSVLNPSATTFQTIQPLLAEAYALAVANYGRRKVRS